MERSQKGLDYIQTVLLGNFPDNMNFTEKMLAFGDTMGYSSFKAHNILKKANYNVTTYTLLELTIIYPDLDLNKVFQ